MTKRPIRQNWAVVFVSAFVALAGTKAMAAGTDAGTSVANTFTLNYDVGGVNQTQIDNIGAETTFTVDRLIDVTVTSQGNTSVVPGETGATLLFRVQNDSNDNVAYSLELENLAGDNFDPTSVTVTYYVDDNDAGDVPAVFEPGGDDGAGTGYTPGSGTPTSDIAPDQILWVLITGDIPASVTNGQQADIALLADSLNPVVSLDPNYTATAGDETFPETGVNDVDGEAQNVLADGTGTATADGDNDGAHSDTGSYIVGAAALTASKAVSILATDGAAFGCANFANTQIDTSQYAAPGACIEYVITVSNAASATQSATNIDVSDFLPEGISFVDAQTTGDLVTNGTFTEPAANCAADLVGPPVVNCEVRVDDAVLAAGESGTITIRALVSTG